MCRNLWRAAIPRRNRDDLLERLRLDAEGPEIAIEYYRQDAADALAEIVMLRKLLNAFVKPAAPAGAETAE